MTCKKCGKELEENAVFCQYCGQKQGEDMTEQENSNNTQKAEGQMSDKKLILIGALIAFAVLAVVAVVKLRSADRQSDVAENTASEEVTVKDTDEVADKADAIAVEDGAPADESNQDEEAESTVEEKTEVVSQQVEQRISHIKSMNPNGSEVYEYWFDEDGDLNKWTYGDEKGASTENFSYLTDANGDKVGLSKEWEAIRDYLASSNTVGWAWFIDSGFGPMCSSNGHLIRQYKKQIYTGDEVSVEWLYDEMNRITEIECEDMQYDFTTDGYDTYNWKGIVKYPNENQISITCDSYGIKREWLFELDSSGRVMSYNYTSDGGGFGEEEYIEKLVYDGNGNVIEKTTVNNGETTSVSMEYLYDNKGNLTYAKNSTQYADGIVNESERKYEYDEDGNLIAYDGDIDNYKCRYDEYGRKERLDGQYTVYEYDDSGNRTREISREEIDMWEYDEEGRWIACTQIYSSTGTDVVEDDMEFIYDEQGRLSEIILNGNTALRIECNDNGRPVKINSIERIFNNLYRFGDVDADVFALCGLTNVIEEQNVTAGAGSGIIDVNYNLTIEYR